MSRGGGNQTDTIGIFFEGGGGGVTGGSEQNFSCQGALSLLDLYRKRKLKPIRNTMGSMS